MSFDEDLLRSDFEQCFAQMRHYEEGFKKTTEYCFAGIAAVATIYTALVGKYGLTDQVALGLTILLTIAVLVGILALTWLAKNRVYYAFVARYVNEVRHAYLKSHPAGVTNAAGMYADRHLPKIFNPWSTHAAYIYVVALLTSGLIVASVETARAVHLIRTGTPPTIHWQMDVLILLLSLGVAIGVVLGYWRTKDNHKNAKAAVWREEKK